MTSSRIPIAAGVAFLGGLFACGTLLGLDESSPPSGGSSSGTSGTTATDGGNTSTGFVDLDANVAKCNAPRSIQPGDLFATPTGSGDSCTQSAPCSITRALDRVTELKVRTTVNLGPGVYSGDLVLPSNAHLAGGWKADWSFDCDQKLAVLQGVQDSRAVRVIDASDTRITLVTIQTPLRLSKPGESFFGVFAVGPTTELTLENVAIGAGPGGDGSDGAQGAAGGQGATGCGQGNGANGSPGTDGVSGGHASCDAKGCTVQQGGSGALAGNGFHGTPGGVENVTGMECSNASGSCIIAECSVNGIPGTTGCGGGGGGGGAGGESGGGSFGVYAWASAKVTIIGGLVAAANAGNGGVGGNGGNGGLGSEGMRGPDTRTGCINVGSPCTATCIPTMTVLIPGGMPGGRGGNGGRGGAGGGGAGGFSFAIAHGDNATIELRDEVKTIFGDAGTGGVPNGAAGRAGERGL